MSLGIARTDLHFAAVYLRHGKRTLALLRMLRAAREMEQVARARARQRGLILQRYERF